MLLVENMSTASTRTRKELDDLLVFGYVRFNYESETTIPNALIKLFFTFYHSLYEILKFSTKWCSNDGFEFLDSNKCIKRILSSTHDYRNILADCDPAFEGIHCWRVKVHNPTKCSRWVVWGIAQNGKKYKTGEFIHDGGMCNIKLFIYSDIGCCMVIFSLWCDSIRSILSKPK